jgi:hypothetical protein
MSADSLRRGRALFAALLLLAAVLRVWVAVQPGLWVDEIFSLAIATGHSLEHPAAVADVAEGDYVEPVGAEPAAVFRRYMEHETPPAGARRVLRAVALSDTSPPLYYLVLDWWLRIAGTSDAALRLFSTACALVAMPLLWSVGRVLGGVRVAAIACLLFAVAPPALYYSGEGRMYALTWVFGLALARLTLALAAHGARPVGAVAWVLTAAAGLLTHYFLAFVCVAMVAWLAVHAAGVRWRVLAALVAAVGLAILPWYVQLPTSLGAWRVTEAWLNARLSPAQLAHGVVRLSASLVNGRGVWGGSDAFMYGQLALFGVLGAAVVRSGLSSFLRPAVQLPCLWMAGSVVGPVVLDLLRHTMTSAVDRYALPGLPAAIVVLACALAHVPLRFGAAVLAATVITWLPGIRDVPRASPRPWQPFPSLAGELQGLTGPRDLVIVNSIPSGVLGIARHVDPRTPIASWVVQLGRRRMPDDAEALTADRCRIAYVRVHDVGARAPLEPWLRERADLEREVRDVVMGTDVLRFTRAARDVRCAERERSGAP